MNFHFCSSKQLATAYSTQAHNMYNMMVFFFLFLSSRHRIPEHVRAVYYTIIILLLSFYLYISRFFLPKQTRRDLNSSFRKTYFYCFGDYIIIIGYCYFIFDSIVLASSPSVPSSVCIIYNNKNIVYIYIMCVCVWQVCIIILQRKREEERHGQTDIRIITLF